MGEQYGKHKDRSPQETVQTITGILDGLGIDTQLRWTSAPFEGVCSNRVAVCGTTLGTNGKGTTEEYAVASAYAELMERIQNGILATLSGEEARAIAPLSFCYAPDERFVSADVLMRNMDPALTQWLEHLGIDKTE